MNTNYRLKLLATLSVALVGESLATQAQTTNYGNFTGTTVTYENVSEYSGTDPGQFYMKSPQVFGDTLDFNPVYSVSVSGAATKIRDSQINFDIRAKSGFGIEGLAFSERGDFTMSGNGTANTLVDVSASFFISILEVDNTAINPVDLTLSMIFSPNGSGTFDLVGAGGPPFASGVWTGSLAVDLDGALVAGSIPFSLGATRVSVALDNTLTGNSESNTSAFIAKKDAKGLSITVVPEPTAFTLTFLGLAGLGAMTIRKRNNR